MEKRFLYAVIVVVFIALIIFLANGGIKPTYFDENAPVLYFYSDSCGVCNYIKPALENLGNKGYKIRPIDVFAMPEMIQKYGVQGTPTFIGPDNERLSGIVKNETLDDFELRLQNFLDKY